MRGRPPKYHEPVDVVTIRARSFYHNIMAVLKIGDADVYQQGAEKIMLDNLGRLSIEQLQGVAQQIRSEIKENQERLALVERVIMDIEIREGNREKIRKKTEEVRDPDTGKVCLVVTAE